MKVAGTEINAVWNPSPRASSISLGPLIPWEPSAGEDEEGGGKKNGISPAPLACEVSSNAKGGHFVPSYFIETRK
jgi:hypothetical protein